MDRYLLSTGRSTYLVEYYIMDLFKLYLQVFPGDIPGANNLGFDFTIRNVTKADLVKTIEQSVDRLIATIQRSLKQDISIKVGDIDIINEEHVKVTITVNNSLTDDVLINLYEQEQ